MRTAYFENATLCHGPSLTSPKRTLTVSAAISELLFSPAGSVREQCCFGRMLPHCTVSTDFTHNIFIQELLVGRHIKGLVRSNTHTSGSSCPRASLFPVHFPWLVAIICPIRPLSSLPASTLHRVDTRWMCVKQKHDLYYLLLRQICMIISVSNVWEITNNVAGFIFPQESLLP